MIVRKLRAKRSWSQEQLADFCGLNVRTIQRVESGQKASLETLKCLASVFEVELSTLTEDITVIDKNSEDWKQLPWWFRFNVWGLGARRQVMYVEFLALTLGVVHWLVDPDDVGTALFFLIAYFFGWIVRYGDNKNVWVP